MTWRSGSKLFTEMWPLIESNIKDRDHRVEFTAYILRKMVRDDMDPYDIEDIHSDVRLAMRRAGIEISEPEKYKDESVSLEPRSWWRFWQ